MERWFRCYTDWMHHLQSCGACGYGAAEPEQCQLGFKLHSQVVWHFNYERDDETQGW